MAISKYEMYNGIVLNRLISKGKSISIESFPTLSNNSFAINKNQACVYIKYSEKRISPWNFTFKKIHQEELKVMNEMFLNVFVILVCHRDGLVCINEKELKLLLDENYEETEWVKAKRLSRSFYSVFGKDGKLDFKIPPGDFPKKIFEVIK
jgi:hypothetical protein